MQSFVLRAYFNNNVRDCSIQTRLIPLLGLGVLSGNGVGVLSGDGGCGWCLGGFRVLIPSASSSSTLEIEF